MEEICVNNVGALAITIGGGIVTVASFLANVLPNPKETDGWLRFVSKAVNFVAVNFNVSTK